MPKDRDQLIEESFEAINFLMQESAELVASLLDYPGGAESFDSSVKAMKSHALLVLGVAVLVFLDSRYEERFQPETRDEDNHD